MDEAHIHLHFGPLTVNVVHTTDDFLHAALQSLKEEMAKMALNTAQLTAAVAAEDTVVQSAITAINGFPALVAAAVATALANAGIDTTTAQAAVDAATAQATTDAAGLTAALTANVSPAQVAAASAKPA